MSTPIQKVPHLLGCSRTPVDGEGHGNAQGARKGASGKAVATAIQVHNHLTMAGVYLSRSNAILARVGA